MKTHLVCRFMIVFLLFTALYQVSANDADVKGVSAIRFCENNTNREYIDQDTIAKAKDAKDTFLYVVNKSGNDIFLQLAQTNTFDVQTLKDKLYQYKFQIGVFFFPFAIGIILTIIIWPFLLCCCCCPCMSKSSNSKASLWPFGLLKTALTAIIVTSILGIVYTPDVQASYNSFQCSLAISIQDILNGNKSKSGQEFIGFTPLVNTIQQMNANVSIIQKQLLDFNSSDSSSKVKKTYIQGSNILGQITRIPNNQQGGLMSDFNYNHFDGSAGTIASSFPSLLGGQNVNGAINVAYQGLNQLNQGLISFSSNIVQFVGLTKQFQSNSKQVEGVLNDNINLINLRQKDIVDIDNIVENNIGSVTLAMKISFGIVLGLGVVSLIAITLMSLCKMYCCRFVIYLICLAFYGLALVIFVIALIFSISSFSLYVGCDFLQYTMQSPQNLIQNMNKLSLPDFGSTVGTCLPGQSGDIINTIPGLNISSIYDLNSITNQFNQYNLSGIQTSATIGLTTLSEFIDSYYFTQQFDFNSPVDKAQIQKISDPKNYPLCQSNNFQQDNWIPNLKQTDIKCTTSNHNAGTIQCPTSIQIQSGQSGSQCFGCLDTTQVLLNSKGNQQNDLSIRYSAPQCSAWVNDANTLWVNYYQIKETNIKPVKNRMVSTLSTYEATDGYKSMLINLQTVISQTKINLQTMVQSITDPKYGILTKFNCQLLGQDLKLISDSICVKTFLTIYNFRFVFAVLAYAVFFSLCFSACSGAKASGMVASRPANQYGQYYGAEPNNNNSSMQQWLYSHRSQRQ